MLLQEASSWPPRGYRFPVSFSDDEMEAATVKVMDMSVGDLVSVGGPDVCPWDGTSTTSEPGAAMSEIPAQHDQASMVEQAIQTEATSARQSVHSRQAAMQHLLPLNCRVAARVTKLPPLDHEPQLPPLPANFILPPEMHPVLGKYTFQGTQATQTSPSTSPNASKGYSLAAAVDLLSGSMPSGAVPAVANTGDAGKWLRYKGAAPPAASG